jgi:PKD repeat protein
VGEGLADPRAGSQSEGFELKMTHRAFVIVLALACGSVASAQDYKWPVASNVDPAAHPPLKTHVQRFLDSSQSANYQSYQRTYRARVKTKYNPSSNSFGAIIGNAYWKYPASNLTAGGRPLAKSGQRGEWILGPESPGGIYDREAPGSGWPGGAKEGNYFLYDFDFDDRGNHYLAYMQYGWGILDDGLSLRYYLSDTTTGLDRCTATNCPNNTRMVVGKVGNEYYAFVGGPANWGIWKVTNTSSPQYIRTLPSDFNVYLTRNDSATQFIASGIGRAVTLHNVADLVAGSTSGINTGVSGTYLASAYDGADYWIVAYQGGLVYRVSSTGVATPIPVSGSAFPSGVTWVAAGGDYLALGDGTYWVRTFKTSAFLAEELTGVTQFTQSYYPIAGEIFHRHLLPFGYNGKVYFIWSVNAVADVYEVQAGDSLAVTRDTTASLGTTNPNAPANTSKVPYYGDLQTFKATPSPPTLQGDIKWSFDYPSQAFGTGVALTAPAQYRYPGQSTSTTKKVRAEVVGRPEVFGETSVTLLVPKARVKVPGGTLIETAPGTPLKLLTGTSFNDASDGVVEGHTSDWTLDSVTTAGQSPTTPFDVGACGSHTLTFTARYHGGAYNPAVSSLSYSVQPYVVSAALGTSTSTDITFNNTSTVGAGFAPGASWTEKWELVDALGGVIQTQETTTTLGTKSAFLVLKSAIPATGGKVRLTISVDGASLPAGCESSVTDFVEIPLEKPDPQIVTTLCSSPTTNAGSCTLSVKSASNRSTSGWSYLWFIGTSPGVAGTTFSPTFPTPGEYTVTVRATNPFGFTEAAVVLSVTTPPCSGFAPQDRLTFSSTDLGGRSFRFEASLWQSTYQFQDCDVFTWAFSDGTGGNGQNFTKTFAADGTYTVTLTVSNPNGSAQVTRTHQVGETQPPPQTCADPSGQVFVGYVGAQSGCAPGLGKPPCNVGETVQFTIDTRPGFSLASCHTQTWQFGSGATPPNSTSRTALAAFTTAGTRTVTVAVSNGSVTTTTAASVNVQNATCGTTAPSDLQINYAGLTSGCFPGSSVPCKQGETFRFSITPGGSYQLQGCETVAWNMGDGATPSSANPFNHTFAGSQSSYTVTLVTTNTHGSSTSSTVVRFFDPSVPKPVVSITPASTKAKIGATVFFQGSVQTGVNHPVVAHEWRVIRMTGGDTVIRTVANEGGISHTFNDIGDYRVEYTATNAGGVSTPAVSYVTVALVQEYSFLIPVVAHLPGANGTQWRTDLQIFNTDPLKGELELEFEFKGGALTITKTIPMTSSTKVYEDFLGELSKPFPPLEDAGPMIVKARGDSPPQMWSRTYTVDASGIGSYGQLIPAIPLDSALQSENQTVNYILPGLEISSQFRTNIGIVNPSLQPVGVIVMARDATEFGFPIGEFTVQVPPLALVQIGDLPNRISGITIGEPFSLNIRTIGNAPIVVYGSMIDQISNDPVYVTGVRDIDREGLDRKVQIVPGAGRLEQSTGTWRSDVVVYNDDLLPIRFDLTYFDALGNKVAEATNQPLGSGAFVKVRDVLKWPKLDQDPGDSFGLIKVTTKDNINRYPIIFQRTYKDRGELGSFGQGITAIAPGEANVRVGTPAFIAGVRADCSYYTNLGLVAVGDAPAKVEVKLLDDVTGLVVGTWQYVVNGEPEMINPNASLIATNIVRLMSSVHDKGTLRIEVLEGGDVWAYASVIAAADPTRGCSLPEQTFDPEYIPAVKMPMP